MVVDHQLALRVVVHRVDREVAARGVLDLRAPDVVAQHPAGRVDDVRLAIQRALGRLLVALHLLGIVLLEQRPEGRDLDDLVLAAAAVDHVDDAEAPADDEGAAELVLDLFRGGVGGDVEVLGPASQQQVAHGAADDVGLEARVGQPLDDLDAALVQQRRIDAVLLGGDFHPLAQRRGGPLGLAQQLVDQFFNHSNSFNIGQPRSRASVSRAAVGLVATGWLTRSSSGRSFIESL